MERYRGKDNGGRKKLIGRLIILLMLPGCSTLKSARTPSGDSLQPRTFAASETGLDSDSGGRSAGLLVLGGPLAPQVGETFQRQQDTPNCNVYIKEITDLARDDGHDTAIRRNSTNGIAVVIYDKSAEGARSTFGIILFVKTRPQNYRERCEIGGYIYYILKI